MWPRARVRHIGQAYLLRCHCLVLWFRECVRPAAVLLDDLVDLLHQANGLSQGDDDLLVMGDVFIGERAALAVLKPLLADLVAANMEIPHSLGHAVEAYGARCIGLALFRRGVEPYGIV